MQKYSKEGVLILVVMEDGLRGLRGDNPLGNCFRVLILVVMEDGLRVYYLSDTKKIELWNVLILVVMEDGLRAAGFF